jgi:hypothetical protein
MSREISEYESTPPESAMVQQLFLCGYMRNLLASVHSPLVPPPVMRQPYALQFLSARAKERPYQARPTAIISTYSKQLPLLFSPRLTMSKDESVSTITHCTSTLTFGHVDTNASIQQHAILDIGYRGLRKRRRVGSIYGCVLHQPY